MMIVINFKVSKITLIASVWMTCVLLAISYMVTILSTHVPSKYRGFYGGFGTKQVRGIEKVENQVNAYGIFKHLCIYLDEFTYTNFPNLSLFAICNYNNAIKQPLNISFHVINIEVSFECL